jgi:hypothetical protein
MYISKIDIFQRLKKTHLKALTTSTVATHPAPTSRISLLVKSALTSFNRPGQSSGKSWATIVLKVAESCPVILRDGDVASNRKMDALSASRSDCAIGVWSGRCLDGSATK